MCKKEINMEQEHQDIERRTNGSNFTEGYDPQRIERLKTIIQDYEDQGKSKRYCIIVDGEMVVPVNAEASNFDKYKRYIIGNTNTVEIRMYFGKSPNFNRHVFKTNYSSLAGTPSKDVDQIVQEALDKERQEQKIKRLEQELERKNKKLKAYKDLEAKFKEKKPNMQEIIKDGIQLMGAFHTMRNGIASPVQGVSDAEVEIHAEDETENPVDLYFKKLKETYSQKDLLTSMQIWEKLALYPDLEPKFIKIINQKIKQNGKA